MNRSGGIHPAAMVAVTAVFAVVTASFHRHEVLALIPLLAYHAVAPPALGVRTKTLLKALLPFQPLLFLFGLPHLFAHGEPLVVAGVRFPQGWVTMLSLLLRAEMTLAAVLLAVRGCGPESLLEALGLFGLPAALRLQMLMTWRYLPLLSEEVRCASFAYRLRTFREDGIRFPDWGPFAGSLLLRAFDRAGRVDQAMRLRGVDETSLPASRRPWTASDTAWTVLWAGFFITVRLWDIPRLLGRLTAQFLP